MQLQAEQAVAQEALLLVGTHKSSMTTEMVWQRVGEGKALDTHLFLVSGGDAAGGSESAKRGVAHAAQCQPASSPAVHLAAGLSTARGRPVWLPRLGDQGAPLRNSD